MYLSDATQAILQQAGWHSGRQIDVSAMVDALAAEGYTITPVVVDFLTEFGGLKVVFPNPRAPQLEDQFHLQPDRAARGVTRERVETYEERVGEPLVTIGENYDMVLLLSASGKMYGGFDDLLYRLGNDPAEGLTSLCTGADAAEVD